MPRSLRVYIAVVVTASALWVLGTIPCSRRVAGRSGVTASVASGPGVAAADSTPVGGGPDDAIGGAMSPGHDVSSSSGTTAARATRTGSRPALPDNPLPTRVNGVGLDQGLIHVEARIVEAARATAEATR